MKPLATKVGKKIATRIGQGAIGGATAGAIHGTGESILNEDVNPVTQIAGETIGGAVLGAAGGAALGKIEKTLTQKELTTNLPQKLPPQYFKKVKTYYKDYEQATNPIQQDLGEIRLISDAMKETNIQNPNKSKEVVNLSKAIKNATYVRAEQPVHNHKYPIKQFHRLNYNNNDYLIAENEKGNMYFYKITDPDLTGPEPEGQSPKNIIPDIQDNVNPKAIEKVTKDSEIKKAIKSSLITEPTTQGTTILKGKVEYNTTPNDGPTGYAAPITTFNDLIRQSAKEKRNKYPDIFARHKTQKPSTNTGKGHWVTMNGAHVFIED